MQTRRMGNIADSDRRLREQGNMLLGMILLVAASAMAVGTGAAVYTKVLTDELGDEVESELDNLAEALVDYWDDFRALPDSLDDLVTRPESATTWYGPYLRGNFVDLEAANQTALTDAWGNAYIYQLADGFEIEVRSSGPDGADDNGDDDDIEIVADIDHLAWNETYWELRVLRAAVTAYNFYASNPSTLPADSWLDAVEAMQNNGYLPPGNAVAQEFLTDGWGQTYMPEGAPITTVNSAGTPDEEEN